MTRNIFLIVGMCALFLFGAIYVGRDVERNGDGTHAPVETTAVTDILEESEDSFSVGEDVVAQPDVGAPPTREEEQIPVVSDSTRNWMTTVGFTTEYNMHYQQTDFLKSQAANGDMLAAQLLGYQSMGTVQGEKYLIDAARWGSVKALHLLSDSHRLKAEGRLNEQQPSVDQHDESIRALAYLFAAHKRGDTFAAPNSVERLMDRFTYTDQDIKDACYIANDIFGQISGERLAEGYAEFNNSPPPDFPNAPQLDTLCSFD